MLKNITLIIFIGVVVVSCSRTSYVAEMKNEIINTDKAFSKLSLEKGMYVAFTEYADDSVIKPRDGDFPITGKNNLKANFASKPFPDFVLEWEPVKAEVAVSGELGYTFGNWKMKTKTTEGSDTVMFGNYVSIWKKQKNGSWKYVFDSGSNTPDPKDQNKVTSKNP